MTFQAIPPALKIFHDLSFKKNNTFSVHAALRVFLSERDQINKIARGQ